MTTEDLCRQDPYLRACEATVIAHDPRGVVLDRTVFYAMGGGQPGDTGWLRFDGRSVEVTDTVRDRESGEVVHVLAEGVEPPPVGASIEAGIDWDRRYRLMRMHSCMHMLSAVITAPVTGGQVWPDRGRLDFDLPEPPDRQQVEDALNALIREDRPRSFRWITDEELAAQPELVRTMSVKPPSGAGRVRLVEFEGIDLQPCGGTHVARSGEIGPVRIEKIEKKGKRNRRVVIVFDG